MATRRKIGYEAGDRSEIVAFKVTPREKAMLERRAKADGEDVSEFLRIAVYSELLTRGDREAFEIMTRAVQRKIAAKFVELGLMNEGERLTA